MPHFQGCSLRRLTQPRQHQRQHQSRNNMSPLHYAPGPKHHTPWTLHLQGWTRQHNAGLFTGALGHKLLTWTMLSLKSRRPNDGTHPSFSKVWHCLSSTKPQDNFYITADSASTRSLRTYRTHTTPMNSEKYAKK